MALFFHLQFFFQLQHLLPLPTPPHHPPSSSFFNWLPPPPYGKWLSRSHSSLSFNICLINRCPQPFSSTGTFSSWKALAVRASSPGALSEALLVFLGTCSSMKLAHSLVQVTTAAFQFRCKVQSEGDLTTAELTVTTTVTTVSGIWYKCRFGPKC